MGGSGRERGREEGAPSERKLGGKVWPGQEGLGAGGTGGTGGTGGSGTSAAGGGGARPCQSKALGNRDRNWLRGVRKGKGGGGGINK